MKPLKEEFKMSENKRPRYLSALDAVDKKAGKKIESHTGMAHEAEKTPKYLRVKETVDRKAKEAKEARTVVTSENREEFMKKKLKLADTQEPVYDDEDEGNHTWQVRYTNHEGEVKPPHVNYDNEEAANKHAKKAVLRELGGKYTVHKIKDPTPIAPVPDRKYIKGTPEHKELKAKQKPITGMPTNNRRK